MTARTLLWFDLRTSASGSDLCRSLPQPYTAQRLCRLTDLLSAVRIWCPLAICFEYDIPDVRSLAALAEIRERHASLPVVMITEHCTRRLAESAFRPYVWDHLVKPVSVECLCRCLNNIEKDERTSAPRANLPYSASTPEELRHPRTTLAPAVRYVATNFSEKLCQATAATLCHMSPFQFSRSFKKEYGVTFRDFVIRTRIARAAELMKQARVSVTEAAFVAGFNDLSYFARMFRRRLGVSPSHYRSVADSAQLSLFPPDELRER